jgi:hypothetical protein
MYNYLLNFGEYSVIRTKTDEIVAEHLQSKRPDLCNNPEKLKNEFLIWERQIDDLIRTRPLDWEPAVNILLQTRNGIAHLLNIKPREIDVDYINISFLPVLTVIPSEKFVVLLCINDLISNAIKAILPEDISENPKYKILDSAATVQALMTDKVAGIVDFNFNKNTTIARIGYSLRHDLKYQAGWNQAKADSKILPPIFASSIHSIDEGFNKAIEMANGIFYCSEVVGNKINFEDFHPTFFARMKVPHRTLEVIIIDDCTAHFQGMLNLLKIWPQINLSLISEFGAEIPEPKMADILFLDHDLGNANYDGCGLLNNWYANEFKGTVVSTTSGKNQGYGSCHFYQKCEVADGCFDASNRFISLMNYLVESIV